jgi:hypothetical protein
MAVNYGRRAAKKGYRALLLLLFTLGIAACNNSPGPLEGVWRSDGALPMKIAFRPGETETLGIIEPVEYKVNGSVVTITYTGGLMKGSSMRFTLVDANRATSPLFNLQRVR